MRAAAPITIELEQAALRAIQKSYQHLNGSLFRFQLRPPGLELTDSAERLGRWLPAQRTIELQRALLLEHGWGVLEEVLKHEMAHQYVDEVLGERGESAHGPVFRRVCQERGIDARAAGAPRTDAADQSPILERIAKLLALAGSPNEHEAQAAMSAAQRLMLKHNIEAAVSSAGPGYCFRHLGKPTGRIPEHERRLALILSEHFFVQVIWVPVWRPLEGKRGSALEVCGSRDNVELAAYVYDFLLYTADALYRADRKQRGDRGHAMRRKFLAGVMSGFHQRLDRERKRSASEGLVWLGDAELSGYFRRRHPHVRWAQHSVSSGGEAYSRGQTAGRRIVLHRGVKSAAGGRIRAYLRRLAGSRLSYLRLAPSVSAREEAWLRPRALGRFRSVQRGATMLDSSAEAFQNVRSLTEGTEIAATPSLVGTVLAGRYRIERLLGSGGMGSVYRAEHVMMRKACAVKVLHREMTQVKEVVARFEREAVAAARIEHPHVATATDFGQLEDGSFYLVLEFVEGRSLSQEIAEKGPLSEERALLATRQIADALSAAHAAGIVHRDLKPDNVMLVAKEGAGDFLKVLDFGIAKLTLEGDPATGQQALTRMNTVMGTPEYMAPEQARGEDVDLRADLYTVGVILYEMLAGRSPFRHEEFVVVLTKKLTEDPPPLPDHVSAATRALVDRLLQRAPADRPESAAEIMASIDAILGYSPSPASTAFAPVSGQARTKRLSASSEVALAKTLLGEVAAIPSEKSWVRRSKQLAAQAVKLARRPVTLGSRQLPLGAVGGALFGLPLLLAWGLSLGSAGSQASPGAAALGAPQAAPVDDDLSELMKRAETGDRTALAELLGRAAEAKLAPAYRALGRGYFEIGQLDAGLRAYRSGGKLDAALGDSPDVLADLRRAVADPPNQALSLEVAMELGAGGADFLYDVWNDNRVSNAPLSKQAKTALDSELVAQHASPALKVALELPRAKASGCQAVKKLLPSIQESGDARVAPALTKLQERRGCGFLGLGDCFDCLRRGKELANALKSVAQRPAPKVGG